MNKFFFTLLLIINTVFNVIAQNKDSIQREKKYEAAFEQGMNYSNAGKFNDAIHWFQTALTYKPNDPEATKMLQLNKKRKAEGETENAYQMQRVVEMADKEYDTGNYEKALIYYERYKNFSGATDRDEKIKICKEKRKDKE